MRQILTRDEIDHNARGLQQQLSRYLDFNEGKAFLLNNADWLTQLNYIEFLRDIGRHFSVNKMLAAMSDPPGKSQFLRVQLFAAAGLRFPPSF
jgi:tyrosyl-tRNA synthetase